MELRKYMAWICLVFALLGGFFAGWVDFNNDEPQAAVLVILVVTIILGVVFPRKALFGAVIVALCLPAVYLIATHLGYRPVSPPSPGWWASLLSLIPACIGAISGMLARWVFNTQFSANSAK